MKAKTLIPVYALLVACSANPVMPGAEKVRITLTEPKDCKYLGDATGNQGNKFTGKWTSNSDLETGARNELKNEAFKLGGDTVFVLSNRAGETSQSTVSGSSNAYGGTGGGNINGYGMSQTTNITYSGTVWKCGK